MVRDTPVAGLAQDDDVAERVAAADGESMQVPVTTKDCVAFPDVSAYLHHAFAIAVGAPMRLSAQIFWRLILHRSSLQLP